MLRVHVFLAEMRRQFTLMRRYWMNELSFALTTYIIFITFLLTGSAFAADGAVAGDMKASILVGMMMWQLSMGSYSVLGWSFFNEAQSGTLEHLYLSPVGSITIFVARSVSNFFAMLVIMSTSFLMATLTTGIRLSLPPLNLAVLIPLGVAGTYGFGFMMAALTMTFKRTQQFMNLTQFFFMIFTGAMFPLDRMPKAMQYFGEALPVTAAIRALREVTIRNATLADVSGDIVLMVTTSAVWLAVGIWLFKVAERRARLKGSIAAY